MYLLERNKIHVKNQRLSEKYPKPNWQNLEKGVFLIQVIGLIPGMVFSASPPPHRPFHQIHPSSSLAFLHTLQPSDLTGHTGSTCLVAPVWRQPVFVPTNDFDFDDQKQEYTQCAEPPERVWIMYWGPNNIFKTHLTHILSWAFPTETQTTLHHLYAPPAIESISTAKYLVYKTLASLKMEKWGSCVARASIIKSASCMPTSTHVTFDTFKPWKNTPHPVVTLMVALYPHWPMMQPANLFYEERKWYSSHNGTCPRATSSQETEILYQTIKAMTRIWVKTR